MKVTFTNSAEFKKSSCHLCESSGEQKPRSGVRVFKNNRYGGQQGYNNRI